MILPLRELAERAAAVGYELVELEPLRGLFALTEHGRRVHEGKIDDLDDVLRRITEQED